MTKIIRFEVMYYDSKSLVLVMLSASGAARTKNLRLPFDVLPAQAAQSLPNYCVRIPEDWDGAGKSLGALKFWRATGATVVAIRRSGQEIVSPGPDTALRCGDLLIFVGDLEARKGVVRFFSSNP